MSRSTRKSKRKSGREKQDRIAPPKITPPRPTRIFSRDRLFTLLDQARRDHRVIWVSAPAGAGKTSLAASYLAARRLPALWYQVDAGDGDIASFFYYMGLAARRAAPRHKKPLPLLTPEYLADVPTFARNYFRELYRRLPKGCVLVFDNYQDAPEESTLHDALHIAMGEVPETLSLLVLSRVEPPAVLARLRLCDHAVCLDWGKMRLTPEETAGISTIRTGDHKLDTAAINQLHERVHGWAAGLVLMLEQSRGGVELNPAETPTSQQLLFDYFAGEILAHSDPAVQDFLLKTALFPKVSAGAARALTGIERAREILEDLTRRNYFTVRHPETTEDIYEYHPLFREFLLKEADRRLGSEAFNIQRRKAAAALECANDPEAALALYLDAGEWDAAIRLLLKLSPDLASTGRIQSLGATIARIPAAVVESEPWLLHWRGLCRVLFAPAEARRDLERAYAAFDTHDDPAGLYLSWAAIIECFIIEWTNFASTDKWIAAFESLRVRHPRFPSREIETRAVFAAVGVFCYRRPDHPELPDWVARAERLLNSIADSNQRILSGMVLHLYYLWLGRYDRAAEFKPLTISSDVEPQCRLIHLMTQAVNQWCFGDPRASFRLVEEGLQMVESRGLRFWKYQLSAQGVYAGCACGDLESASRYLEQMSPLAGERGCVDVALYHHLASMAAWHRQNLSSAVSHAETALRLAQETGVVFAEACCQFMVATLASARGETEKVAMHFAATRRLGERMRSPWIAYMCYMGEAYFTFQQGRIEQSLPLLREALSMSRERGIPALPWMPHAILARLYAAALEHDIERDQVQALIRKFGIGPDDNAFLPDTWPFPVKLHTLGRFSALVNDKPLKFTAKAQKKPMELLKCLVALGGRGVPESKLSEALWPEAEGDAAAQSLATTLHRLRKLLGEEAIERREGRLTLNPKLAWVDLWVFERQMTALESACRERQHEDVARLSDRMLNLYRGGFLQGEHDAPWALAMRERLRAKCLRLIETTAGCLTGAQHHELALACYQKAIEMDPLAEGFHRGLMRCYHVLGRRAEALTAYERCRELLAGRFGVAPSPETEKLRRTLLE